MEVDGSKLLMIQSLGRQICTGKLVVILRNGDTNDTELRGINL
jgi:hypothetical protein